jgi:hypothetical protein
MVPKFRFFRTDNPKSPYLQYRTRSWQRKLGHAFQRRKLIYEFLDNVYASPTDATALGYKMSYNHLEAYPAIAQWLKENNIHIIHYIRGNLLKRYLSSRTSKMRRLPHSTKPVKAVQVHIDIRKLKQDLQLRSQQIARYRAAFADNPYLEVLYESFVTDRDAETRRVLQFLGIDEFVPLQSSLVKLNPDSLSKIIENYGQVAQALKNTAYESYLQA